MPAIHQSTEEYWDHEGMGTATGQREWTRAFKVLFQTVPYAPEVLDAPGVPRRWSPHPADPRMTARKATAKTLQGAPLEWMVLVEYTNYTIDEPRGEDDPRDRPTEIETDFVPYQSPFYYDLDGKAVLNSAGDPYDPLPMMEDSRPIIRMRRFEDSFAYARSLAYRNAVNTDAWFGFEPGEVMCMYIKQRRHYENTIECWDTSYEFQVKANGTVLSKGVDTDYFGWDSVLADVGYNEITGGERVMIEDDKGRPVSSPVRLDGFGNALDASATFEETSFGIHRPPYRYLPFAPLLLP